MISAILEQCCRGGIRGFSGKHLKNMHPKSTKSAYGMHSEKIKYFSIIPKNKKR
jgi:hypothetical protein